MATMTLTMFAWRLLRGQPCSVRLPLPRHNDRATYKIAALVLCFDLRYHVNLDVDCSLVTYQWWWMCFNLGWQVFTKLFLA